MIILHFTDYRADGEQLAVMLQLDPQYRFQVWATLVPLFVAVIKHRMLLKIIA